MAKSVAKTKNEDPILVGLRSTTLFGVLILLVGVAMLFFPAYSTYLSAAVFGWLIIFAGIVSVFNAIVRRESGFWGRLILGIIFFLLGAFVLRNPLLSSLPSRCLSLLTSLWLVSSMWWSHWSTRMYPIVALWLSKV